MSDTMEEFEKAPVPKAVLKNAIPVMAALYLRTSRKRMAEPLGEKI